MIFSSFIVVALSSYLNMILPSTPVVIPWMIIHHHILDCLLIQVVTHLQISSILIIQKLLSHRISQITLVGDTRLHIR